MKELFILGLTDAYWSYFLCWWGESSSATADSGVFIASVCCAGLAALQRYDYVVSGNTLTGTYSWQWSASYPTTHFPCTCARGCLVKRNTVWSRVLLPRQEALYKTRKEELPTCMLWITRWAVALLQVGCGVPVPGAGGCVALRQLGPPRGRPRRHRRLPGHRRCLHHGVKQSNVSLPVRC